VGSRTNSRCLISQILAAVGLAGLGLAELDGLVADEALGAVGGERAVLWRRVRRTRRFTLDLEGGSEAVELSDEAIAALPAVPHLLDDADEQPWGTLVTTSLPARSARQSVLVLPLLSAGDLLGVLLVLFADDRGDGEDPALALPFARQVGALLANWQALSRAAATEAGLRALSESAGQLTSTLDLGTVLAAIVERARALVDSPISYIMLVNEEANAIYMRVTSGVSDPSFADLRLHIGEGLGGWVADRQHYLESEDYLNDSRFTHQGTVDMAVRAEGIRSILGVPLVASGHFVGVLYVADRTPGAFDGSEVAVLTSLADHAAVAIENTALYERATEALAEVERANTQIRAQYAGLERAEQLNAALSEALLAGHGLPQLVELMAAFLGARVVALDVLMERAVAESERRLGSEFLRELFAVTGSVPGGLQRRATELGIDLDEAHRLVVLRTASNSKASSEVTGAALREAVIKRLRQEHWCPFVSEWNGRVVALVRGGSPDVPGELVRVLKDIAGSQGSVHGALSARCDRVAEYLREFVACDRLLRVFPDGANGGLIDLEEARVLGLLFRQGAAEVLSFVESVLGPLVQDDARTRELVRTLEAYLAAAGSPGQAAKALHVHVNTIYYRLDKIRDLLGGSFDDPRAALDLQVALLARRLVAAGDLPHDA
jgi:GAF domain-containing protein